MKFMSVAIAAAVLATSGTPELTLPSCSASRINSWLNWNSGFTGQALPDEHVFRVKSETGEAIERLAEEPASALSAEDFRRFTGLELPSVRDGLRPFLVRAVYPTSNPQISAFWDGTDLAIQAGGLGCAPFLKHPVILFLDGKPQRVMVAASAAL